VVDDLCIADAAGRALLHRVSLRIAPGERVHLTGRNGAGKSTLLRAVAGLLRPTSGRIRIAGVDRARPGAVGLLFQNPERNLFERNVEDEIAFGLRRLGWRSRDVTARVRDVLARCGLEHVRERSPLRLAFGEQHRVALASVLAPQPRLLLLDEPWTGLDPESRARTLELLDREQAAQGFAVLLASHDPPSAGRGLRAARQLTLHHGKLR
jgi:energy-coupling factor transport system ATP-binding protein